MVCAYTEIESQEQEGTFIQQFCPSLMVLLLLCYGNISDSEPFLDRRQQCSVSSAWLRCALRHRDSLHDTSPPLSQRSVWFSWRAQSWRSHGTDSHGQSVRRVRHADRHQCVRPQHGPWPKDVQHCRFAHEGQGAQRSHILGNMRWQSRRMGHLSIKPRTVQAIWEWIQNTKKQCLWALRSDNCANTWRAKRQLMCCMISSVMLPCLSSGDRNLPRRECERCREVALFCLWRVAVQQRWRLEKPDNFTQIHALICVNNRKIYFVQIFSYVVVFLFRCFFSTL